MVNGDQIGDQWSVDVIGNWYISVKKIQDGSVNGEHNVQKFQTLNVLIPLWSCFNRPHQKTCKGFAIVAMMIGKNNLQPSIGWAFEYRNPWEKVPAAKKQSTIHDLSATKML